MITINIRDNFPEVRKALRKLPEQIGNKAMVRSLNATITQGRTDMARAISKEFRIKVGEAKDRLTVKKARATKQSIKFEAELQATRSGGLHGNDARGMNLIHFVTKTPTRSKKGKLSQLKFQIKRVGGPKIIMGAFIATSRKTGGTAVFVRTGKGRMPIETKTTIDIPQMFNTKRLNQAVRASLLKRFEKNFERELRAVLKGYVK